MVCRFPTTFPQIDDGEAVRIRGMSVEDLCDHLRSQECSWAETYVRYNGVDGARFLSLDTADMKVGTKTCVRLLRNSDKSSILRFFRFFRAWASVVRRTEPI